ncbi:hypothetical protein F5X96DRAFT_416037 [Biscogniauxia mediterranea]|nr:hypothetical protein F5X96DRAFT_416037 [Biscogniauxia mediterranea]
MKTQAIATLASVLALAAQAQAKITFGGIDTNWKGQQRNRWFLEYDATLDRHSEITSTLNDELVAPRFGNIQHGSNGNGNYYYHVTLGKGEGTDVSYFAAIKRVFKRNDLCAEMGLEPGWMTERCEKASCEC